MDQEMTQESVRQFHKAFFTKKAPVREQKFDRLFEMWGKSLELGIDPASETVPASAQHQEHNLPENKRFTFDCVQSIVAKVHAAEQRVLEHFCIAVFEVADFESDILIYGKAGHKGLLENLSNRGITIGTSLSVTKIGLTAASECLKTNKSIWLIGRENFLDCLSDYAIYAAKPTDTAMSFSRLSFFQIYIIPMSHYSEMTKDFIEFAPVSKNIPTNTSLLPQLTIKDRAFDEFLYRNEVALLITNKHQVIIDVSKYCSVLLGLDYLDCCGQKYFEVIPELKDIFILANREQKRIKRTVVLSSGREILFEYEPMNIRGKLLGATLYATDTSKAKRNSSSVVDSRAHYTFENIIGKTNAIVSLKETAERAAKNMSSVLLVGEHGTGKDLLAHAIHSASPRRNKPFVTVHCGGIMETMIESVLFGNVEKVFSTEQSNESVGKIEQAHEGTIFFSNIDELPLHIQSILANVLKTGLAARKGSNIERPCSVRVIASSNKNLYDAVKNGSFRSDLYYHLSVINLSVPPLRDRLDDLPLLANAFLRFLNGTLKKSIVGISTAAMNCLLDYSWPGNIRELQNVLEQSVDLETTPKITYQTLPNELKQQTPLTGNNSEIFPDKQTYKSYEDSERNRIKNLMIKYSGNKSKVASELGITRSTLYRKLNRITDWGE